MTRAMTILVVAANAALFGEEPAELLKPGFELVLGEHPSLSGYRIINEKVETYAVSRDSLVRFLHVAKDDDRLHIRIGVARTANQAREFLAELKANTQLDADRHIVSGASLGLALGDESLVRTGSTPDHLKAQVAFRRKNIFVSIAERTAGGLNLKPIATEIDGAIQKLPDVAPGKTPGIPSLDDFVPRIDAFSSKSPSLRPGDSTELVVSAVDPQGIPLKYLYRKPNGYVLPGPPDRYKAGSKTGTQTLSLIVYNSRLLFDQASIDFDVAPR